MEWISSIILILVTLCLIWAWKVLNWLWLRPKKLEKLLREQGLQGNPYRILVGDTKDLFKMEKEARSKSMNLTDDILPRVNPYIHHSVKIHGKNSFIWFGIKPRVTLTEPEQIKDVLNKISEFPKTNYKIFKLLASGVASHEGEKWSKHRRLINPAFHLEKLKIMTPAFFTSCNDLISNWEGMLSSDGSCEIDVWPSLQNLASDAISRTAFGSSYEEGKRIFQLQREQAELITKAVMKSLIPLWMFLPTIVHKRMNEVNNDIKSSLKDMINKREKALKAGESTKNDLLGILLESNQKEIEENESNKNVGMSIDDVIEECKLFYFAGQETTSVLLVWTMILLSRYPDWQTRARDEVLNFFGNKKPDFDGLNNLKIVTMILYEVLRLYPPVIGLARNVQNDVKLGNLTLPGGVEVFLPILLLHHDCELWGDDAKMFNPERFSGGISKATNGRVSFFPFGWGPRICLGQNFSLLEAKMAMAMILQHFSFELSPTYAHAPSTTITLRPQYGAHIILRKVET
ncbi:cytochrome P450 72A68-like isoform X9 [Trifolium pratense]|uniref:cytochrome P450 72A68-like isoform X7 n=1 Tax=Trifolium pratense TaxID=57577 RepID=UPI001E6919B1|nr:cytochrome P450 72A68-like isoform X7 [Trifolium pratense]XP_045801122.1 cytochrome P450 72A68-like isoform X8 [Trifolium pratense]XP_045801123.1 cytochrome P450 72A68-like isoform X9 [Trifolium pratense]